MPQLKNKPKSSTADTLVIELQERVRVLEQQVATLVAARKPEHPNAWLDRIAGRFANDPDFDEAMRLGAAWRRRENRKSIRELERQGLIDADPRHGSPDGVRQARKRRTTARKAKPVG